MLWFLTIDVGTTSVKAAAISATGELLAAATAPYATLRPQPNHVEQDPHAWWAATKHVVGEVLKQAAASELEAVGLSGMAATHVLLDGAGRVLRPAILWQDTRAHREAEELARELGQETIASCFGAGLPLTASAQAARMLWLARHEPDTWKRTAVILGSKDYIIFRLTGELATDPTSSSGFAHLVTGELHPLMAEATRCPPAKLPRRMQPHALAGVVSAQAMGETGIPAGTPVATGMIDSWCNMLGAGVQEAGDAFDTAGTAEVVGIASESSSEAARSRHSIYRLPFLTGVDVAYGVTQCGTDALTWFAESLAERERAEAARAGTSAYALLSELAKSVTPGAGGLLFLPYLEGERSPFMDPRARGGFFGLHRHHGKAHMVRSVLEGVAFSVRHVLETCERETGQRAAKVVVTSGGSKSELWNQIKADVLQRPLVTLEVEDAGLVGAAILAVVAQGGSSLVEVSRQMVRMSSFTEPRSDKQALYDELYGLYLEAGQAVTGLHHRLADVQGRKESHED
jgi:xylulokinase